MRAFDLMERCRRSLLDGGTTRRPLPWLVLTTLVGCKKDEEVTYVQFNKEDDSLEVAVGAETVTDAISILLYSSTGEVTVGVAEVNPGGGPIGTEHEIVVVVEDAYENVVDRVTVRTDSGERGEDEYTLESDSADEGYYKTTLTSEGEAGETRTDLFTFRLWDVEDDEDAEGTDTGNTPLDTGTAPKDTSDTGKSALGWR